MVYRDDREAQFARLEAAMRENGELRDENAQLRRALASQHLVNLDPPWTDPAYGVDDEIYPPISRAEIVLAALLTGPVVFGTLYGLSRLF